MRQRALRDVSRSLSLPQGAKRKLLVAVDSTSKPHVVSDVHGILKASLGYKRRKRLSFLF